MPDSLKPWYAVATPHEDIRKGRLDESVFAANIWAVVKGTAPEVYIDAEEFFKKTYMTAGLSTVLRRVASALKGDVDSGDRIISLQTAFGGGKTHTLVALWHMARFAMEPLKGQINDRYSRIHKEAHWVPSVGKMLEELYEINLPIDFPYDYEIKGVAVFTNATCDATQGRKTTEGVHTRTLWGELAFQLGGKKLYEKIRANDEAQRVPQGLFVEVLREAAPCLILLDELADYCVGAAAVPVGDTTLADQTISFIQQLEEAVAQVPGAVVVATLPASSLEVAQSEKGQELFSSLEKRFQRLGADIKPVSDDEIYNVVRSRLFESLTPGGEEDYPSRVARAYQEMYASHSGEVPSEASKNTYRNQIERSYPFHPLLIDALYTRWGSHPDFQRTRGVLRLLASIVGDLWDGRGGNSQTQHLIQPCHINWSIDAMQATLTRLWGPPFQAVAAADVLGAKSNSAVLDEERGGDYRRERIGQGLASAILLGSFGGQGQKSGFSAKDLRFACSRYGLNWSYTDGALLELENRCFYLHTAVAGNLGKRYWFGSKPALNMLVVRYRHQNAKKTFDEEILEALRTNTQKGIVGEATWRVVVNPEADLPEQKALTLLILPPSLAWGNNGGGKETIRERILELSKKCGGKERIYRNTLLFLAGTPRGLSRLRQAHRELTALEDVKSDYWDQLDVDQKDDLKKRLEAAERSALESLGPAYTVVLRVRGQEEVEHCMLNDARSNFQEHLRYIWKTLVEEEEWILRRVGSVTLQRSGLIPNEGGIRLKDAIDAFLRFTDKPMIASKRAVTTGLKQACLDRIVGIARGGSITTLQTRNCGEAVALDPNEEGVWVIPPFEAEKKEETSERGGASTSGGPVETAAAGPGDVSGPSEKSLSTSGEAKIKRFVVRGAVPVDNYGEIFRCFVGPATKMNLKKLRLGIQFEMETGEGKELDPTDTAIKSMKEAARQLGLDFEVEE